MILSPYFWIAALLAALAIFGTGYHNGYKHANDHAEALQLQAVAKAKQKALEQDRKDQQIAQSYETKRETVRTVFVKIKEKVHENIKKNADYGNCSLDADGLRLYNSHPGRNQDSTGGADSTMPGSDGRSGRQAGDDPGKQPGAGANVLRLPGAPQSLIAMGSGIGGTGITEIVMLAQ